MPDNKSETPKRTRKKGETIKEKVHRHLRDKNDVITDEDIRDAVAGKDYEKESEEKVEDELSDADNKKKNKSAWQVLDDK